jgi:hypothetical protein
MAEVKESMTLSRALRYKKRVIESIRSLEEDIKDNNSVVEGTERETDVRTMIKNRAAWVTHLVNLKLEIQQATQPIQDLVLQLAEAKSEIAFVSHIDTTQGVQKDRWAGASVETRMNAVIRKAEKDEWVKRLQLLIDSLQTQIDDHNAKTVIGIKSPVLA